MTIELHSIETLLRRIVSAVEKTITEDVPQERREKADMESTNYLAHFRGDRLNTNLRKMVAVDRIELHSFKRHGWDGRILIDRDNLLTVGVTTQGNLRTIPKKKDRTCPNYMQTLLNVLNGDLKNATAQLSMFPLASQFDDKTYAKDFENIMAGVLDPTAGFHHYIVGYAARYDEIRSITLYLLDAHFNVVEEHDLREFIKPDISHLTMQSKGTAASTPSKSNARSLVKLKAKPGVRPALKKENREKKA